MPIPDAIRTEAEAHLDRYCVDLIPKHAQDKVRTGNQGRPNGELLGLKGRGDFVKFERDRYPIRHEN